MVTIEVEPGFDDFESLLSLLKDAFAYMDGRIDPPSSLHRLDLDALKAKVADETLLVAKSGEQLIGCLFVRRQQQSVYLGKLAIVESFRGKGIARQFIDVAQMIANQWSCDALELETRVELTENQQLFEHLGFKRSGQNAHPGYDQPTSYRYRRDVN